MIKKLLLISVVCASVFALNNVELNMNDKDLEMGVRFDMGQFNDSVEPDTIFVGAKALNGDETHSDLIETEPLYELNFMMKRNVADTNFAVGFGIKANYTKDFAAIPVGAEVTYKLPFFEAVPFYLGGSIYYAPEMLAMSDAKSFLEYRGTLDMEVIKNGLLYVGYRSINTNYDNALGDINYNDSAFAGFRLGF